MVQEHDTGELYYRDLSARQNKPVTEAEKDLFRTAKRYSDKELRECFDQEQEQEQEQEQGQEQQ